MKRKTFACGFLLIIFVAVYFVWRNHGSSHQHVIDEASLLDPRAVTVMNGNYDRLLKDTDVDFIVYTVTSLQGAPLSQRANEIFQTLHLGQRTRANRGVLLLIAVKEQQVRLHTSYEMEAMLTDEFVSYVEHKMMVPYFEANLPAPGIMATAELIANRVYAKVLNQTYDPGNPGPKSISGFFAGGGGVESPFKPHLQTMNLISDKERAEFSAQPTPAQAWEKVLEIERRHINDVRVGLFDDDLRHLWSRMPLTEAQMETGYRRYAGKHYEVRQKDDLAVIYYPDDPNHLLAPMFLKKGPEGWHMDGRMYPSVVVYNHLNQWGFGSLNHPYAFAFPNYDGLFFNRRYPKKDTYLGLTWTDRFVRRDGIVAVYVTPHSPAALAGVEAGDVINACDSQPMTIQDQLSDCLYAHDPGEKMTLKIYRGSFPGPEQIPGEDEIIEPATTGLDVPRQIEMTIILGRK